MCQRGGVQFSTSCSGCKKSCKCRPSCLDRLSSVLTAVFLWLGKHARSTTIEASCFFFLATHYQWQPQGVIAWSQASVSFAVVHVCQLGLHVLGRDHRRILDAERFENILLYVVVELFSGYPLKSNASPVNVDLTLSQTVFIVRHGLSVRLTPYSQPSPGWNKSGEIMSSSRPLNSSTPPGSPQSLSLSLKKE